MRCPKESRAASVQSTDSVLQRKCAFGTKANGISLSPTCGEVDERKTLKRKVTSDKELGEVPPIVYDVLSSPGQRLDIETRAFFEPRFRQDFSRVRVHADQQAADSAKSVNARAYTVGRDIAFGTGEYRPTSRQGRQLLAHELTHVVQNANAPSLTYGELEIGATTSELETEAIAVSASIERNELAPDALSDRQVRQTTSVQPQLSRSITSKAQELTSSSRAPCTSCGEDECNARKDAQDQNCESDTTCEGAESEWQAMANMAKKFACYVARWKLMKFCYGGGDFVHEKVLADELNGFYKCKRKLDQLRRERINRYSISKDALYAASFLALVAVIIVAASGVAMPAAGAAAFAVLLLLFGSFKHSPIVIDREKGETST